MHHLTYSLWAKHHIPFLVLEPAKKEYRTLCNLEEMKEMQLFSPCANMRFPLHINPFEFPKGLTVAEHIRTLCAVFEGAFPLENPMPFLLDTAIENIYRDMGWFPEMVYTDAVKLKFPTMSMLYKKLEEEMEKTTYSAEVRGNLESALKVRIGGLLRREMGEVFDVATSSLRPEEWLKTPAVIELEAMGSGPANFLTLMLCSLIRECLKVDPVFNPKKTRHVIFIEEAHNLIGPEAEERTGEGANAKVAATSFVVKMLAEVRALRESVFIADQLPSVMAQEVIKNTGLKVALRLTAMDDRQILCNSMSASASQVEDMGTFLVGEALISYEGLQRPFQMRMNEYCGTLKGEEKLDAVTPKNDVDLFELMKTRDSYRKNLEQSVWIIAQKLGLRYAEIIRQCNNALTYFENARADHDAMVAQVTTTKEKIDASNQRIAEIRRQYHGDMNAAVNNEAEMQYLLKEYDYLNGQLKQIEGRAAEKRRSAMERFSVVKEALQFVTDVTRKWKYFTSLGLHCTPEQEADILSDKTRGENTPRSVCAYYYMRTLYMQNTFSLAAAVYAKACLILPFGDTVFARFAQIAKTTGLQLKIRDPRQSKN